MTDSTATLIRNGRVITASDDYVADVLLKDGIVHTIGQAIEVGPGVRVVDATGLYVLPGGVDTHVHLENVIGPTITADTFASGTKAAAFGGTTTIVDFALRRVAGECGLQPPCDRDPCGRAGLEGRALRHAP